LSRLVEVDPVDGAKTEPGSAAQLGLTDTEAREKFGKPESGCHRMSGPGVHEGLGPVIRPFDLAATPKRET
jgi:hypothetical protein